MTKDLSRQLCELAGIEAKYRYWLNGALEYDNCDPPSTCYGKGQLIRAMKEETISAYHYEGKEFKGYKDVKPKVISVNIIYPNFETPENFVKLLEICHQTKNYRGLFFTTGYTADCTFYEAFMCNILSDLTTGIFIEEQVEQLKQALQAEKNWRY